MGNEKIKPVLNGTAETMLQCFYARGMHTLSPAYKLVTWIPLVSRFSEKILVFEKA